MKDCTTCKYGYEDERLGIPMCHHPKRFSEDCVDFNMHEEKETEESEKPIEQEKEVKRCHKTRNRLAEWSKTPEGRESYEKVAEEMRKEISEKPMQGWGLEEEIREYLNNDDNNPLDWDWMDKRNCAHHFYELGCRRTAEKYDEIEYNRQRAEESVPNDLKEAARKSAIAPFNLDVDEEHLYEYPYLPIAEQKFIEGAKWQKEQDEKEQADLFTIVALDAAQRAREQMMNEAVEGEVVKDINNKLAVTAKNVNLDKFKFGEKVRIIIVKE